MRFLSSIISVIITLSSFAQIDSSYNQIHIGMSAFSGAFIEKNKLEIDNGTIASNASGSFYGIEAGAELQKRFFSYSLNGGVKAIKLRQDIAFIYPQTLPVRYLDARMNTFILFAGLGVSHRFELNNSLDFNIELGMTIYQTAENKETQPVYIDDLSAPVLTPSEFRFTINKKLMYTPKVTLSLIKKDEKSVNYWSFDIAWETLYIDGQYLLFSEKYSYLYIRDFGHFGSSFSLKLGYWFGI